MAIPTRAVIDGLVRDPLLADPRTAVAALIGTEIPEAITCTIHEESLTDVHLVIPALQGEEISEDDLELVAGGNCWANTNACTP